MLYLFTMRLRRLRVVLDWSQIMSKTPDVLADVLEASGFSAAVVGLGVLTAPWSIRFPGDRACAMHAVLHGDCVLKFDEQRRGRTLAAGSVVILLKDVPHTVSDAHHRIAQPLTTLRGLSRHGRVLSLQSTQRKCDNGGALMARAETRTVSAAFDVRLGANRTGMFASLPDWVILPPASGGAANAVAPYLALLVQELTDMRAGHQAAACRLAESLFIAALRLAVAEPTLASTSASLLHGLSEPRLSRALTALHKAPEQRWSVPTLAAVAGMSRSAFAALFLHTVGVTPHAYLNMRRMEHAAMLLRHTTRSVADVACASGFASESSFSRLFSRTFALAPGRYRRRERAVNV
jgi:AraC-like DNA-binding protein